MFSIISISQINAVHLHTEAVSSPSGFGLNLTVCILLYPLNPVIFIQHDSNMNKKEAPEVKN